MRKGTRQIPLTQGKYAIVDAIDYEWLMQWKWYAHRETNKLSDRWYALRGITHPKKGVIRMHREIAIRANIPNSKGYDHKNQNGLDNRRENIRPCNHAQNGANTRKTPKKTSSKYKGVTWCRDTNKWRAQIGVMGKHICLGRFLDESSASEAYKAGAVKYFGEFAHF